MIVLAVLALLAGGYLGYRYGRAVERKAQALAVAVRERAAAGVAAVKAKL